MLRPAGVERRIRRVRPPRSPAPRSARSRPSSTAVPRRWWCRRARAPPWSVSSGPSCSRWSATHDDAARARRVGAHTYELSEFLATGPTRCRPCASTGRCAWRCTRAATCSASCGSSTSRPAWWRPSTVARRSCGTAPTAAAASAAPSASSCPRRRWRWRTRSYGLWRRSGARPVVGCDTSCLMHLQTRADATGAPIHVRHLAEVLAAALPDDAEAPR